MVDSVDFIEGSPLKQFGRLPDFPLAREQPTRYEFFGPDGEYQQDANARRGTHRKGVLMTAETLSKKPVRVQLFSGKSWIEVPLGTIGEIRPRPCSLFARGHRYPKRHSTLQSTQSGHRRRQLSGPQLSSFGRVSGTQDSCHVHVLRLRAALPCGSKVESGRGGII
jgi:hypothetical protein